MNKWKPAWVFLFVIAMLLLAASPIFGSEHGHSASPAFPRSLDSYGDSDTSGILNILVNRIEKNPFNLAATIIFILAILHTFLTSRFLAIAHKWENEHREKLKKGLVDKYSVHHGAELFHFLGEVEAVFGIWAMALVGAIFYFYDWTTAVDYLSYKVNFTEAMFVVVIMTLAATRAILKLAEWVMYKIASALGGGLAAWWFTILILGPVLGSFITEPAAMTISALLLGKKLYDLNPSKRFKYATLGLLFVNISVGGTLSNFAAPPVLMVAGPWDWGMGHMVTHFGWKVVLGMLISNGFYYLIFRREIARLQEKFSLTSTKEEIQKKYIRQKDLEAEFDKAGCILNNDLGFAQALSDRCHLIRENVHKNFEKRHLASIQKDGVDMEHVEKALEQQFEEIRKRTLRKNVPGLLPEAERPMFVDPEWNNRDDPVPVWIMITHVLFMVWTVINAHHPALFIAGLLFFLGFAKVTSPYQNRIDLKPPLLVGFFIGGLIIHGGVQGWWIAPVLSNLGDTALLFSATGLTAFNDNAAITFLSTLVPGFTDNMKYAVVAGAVAGGGLTVIANAPNPAGQAILKKYFENGVSPVLLLMGAAVPTAIMILCLFIFRV